ncbi:MAG: hypothetical protein AAF974_06860 [Cyanobacteria bacterium P01_E01_bin.34]
MNGYTKRQLAQLFAISLPTVRETLSALSIPTRQTHLSEREAKYFALARWMKSIEGLNYDEIARAFQLEPELDNSVSIADMALRLSEEQSSGMTKPELSQRYKLSLKTIKTTLEAMGLSSRKQRYSGQELEQFQKARQLKDRWKLSYSQLSEQLRTQAGQFLLGETLSKQELAKQYGIQLLAVRKTLQAAGLSTSKRRYSELESKRFRLARQLLEQGWQYSQVAARMKGTVDTASPTQVD